MMESHDSHRLRRQVDGHLRRLMEYYFRSYGVAQTEDNADRFLGVYDCLMCVVPVGERDASRLDRLVRAAFGVGEATPRAEGAEEAQVTATIADLTARYSQEHALRQEEEALRKRTEEELRQAKETVSTVYTDLLDQIARQQRLLAEREAELVRQERQTHERLRSVHELESKLQTALERHLHDVAHTALDGHAELLAEELAAIRGELGDLVGAHQDPPAEGSGPLVTVIRRLKKEADAAGLDPLTGLRTRQRFEDELGECLERFRQAARSGNPTAENVALLHIHIDGFQTINDRRGRAVGDAVLQQVASALNTLRRGTDVAYRFGGAEMIVMLPRTAIDGARNVAEILRHQIADMSVAVPGGEPVSLTVSIGVCDAVSAGSAVAACAAGVLREAGAGGGHRTVSFSDDASLASLAEVVPVEFSASVRDGLLREERFSLVAVRTTAPDRLAELQRRVDDRVARSSAHRDGVIYLLDQAPDAKAALHAVESALEGIPSRAAATDVSEAPPADAASPGARAHALLAQLVEMIA